MEKTDDGFDGQFASGGTNFSSSNGYDPFGESITVQLKAYKEEVLRCIIRLETSEAGFYDFFPLYDKGGLIHRFRMFKYIGDTDNSCSFIIYPKHYVFESYFNEYEAFKGKWTIIEKYSCEKSLWNIVTFVYDWERQGCYREYDIYFNPRTSVEVMSMTWAATKIIRKAPYDDKTLTVFLQSERQPISLCILNIGFNFFDLRRNDIIIYNKYTSYSSSAELGIEYIGFNDNSCSVRINLDLLNTTNKEDDILNQDWMFTVMHVDYKEKNSIYSFHMGSKNWWFDNHYSKVFLRKKFLSSTDVQHY
ncbi:hypothetical protein HCN44_005514 [Aphidius gifuensis]|uniref:Uncharacterized protein n=1 Tax=Aphidius gifuensis TaxID=684658 RepID=A0A834Y5P3_APHGI|nr:hypothetical protein HCN44_005514 [Aphidius gifuensis]